MAKEYDNSLRTFWESVFVAEAPEIKKARKKYNKWFEENIPLYQLIDTNTKKPHNWEDEFIWTSVQSDDGYWLTNGFLSSIDEDDALITDYVFTQKAFSAPRSTLKIYQSMDGVCPFCEGEGRTEEEDFCSACDDSGYVLVEFVEPYSRGLGPNQAPILVTNAKELPDPPFSVEQQATSKPKFCSECGTKFAEAAKFCSECGKSVS